MQENKSLEIIFIIDKSGSMAGQETDVLTGYNSILCKYRAMKLPIRFTTILFSYDVEYVSAFTPISQLSPLKPSDYRPGGGTALYDAIGTTVDNVTTAYRNMPNDAMPSRTLCFITTDGLENSSRHYDKETVNRLIQQMTEDGWQFEFLGAGIDAFAGADDVGISRRNAHSFDNVCKCMAYCDERLYELADAKADANHLNQDVAPAAEQTAQEETAAERWEHFLASFANRSRPAQVKEDENNAV